MAFTPKEWLDQDTSTPANAAGMIDLEERLSGYTDDEIAALDTVYAPLDSPALTGTPLAPTPTAGDDSNKVATTAFVTDAVAAGGGGGGVTPLSWTGLSFNTNWGDDSVGVNFDAGWVKDDYNVVHLRGFVKRNAAGGSWTDDVIATLPAGAKPAKNIQLMALGEDNAGREVICDLSINRTTGDIQINSMPNLGYSPDYSGQVKVRLDGITYPTVA